MSAALEAERPVNGRVDAEGRLIEADPPLAELNQRAGGGERGMLSVPQIATLARLARRLGITISRAAIAADGDRDIDLWVRAEPDGEEVALSITGWAERPAQCALSAAPAEREADFLRATADWSWETDDTLRLTALSSAASAAIGRTPTDLIGGQLTRLFRFRESEEGTLPILTALAEHQPFEGQIAELRTGRRGRYLLSGVPLIDGMGRFAGFRGAAVSLRAGEAPPSQRQESPQASAFGDRLDQALRTPLAHIVENAERLRSQPEGPLRRDYTGYAADIASAGRHLLSLVDDLVDLQAIERPDFAPQAEAVDLSDIARRAAGLLAVRAAAVNVRIITPSEDEELPATADFTRALQVLMNLITNAIRYSPEGGEVWVRSGREGDLAAITVADQGKGIAPEHQVRIFEKFERIDPSEPGAPVSAYILRVASRGRWAATCRSTALPARAPVSRSHCALIKDA